MCGVQPETVCTLSKVKLTGHCRSLKLRMKLRPVEDSHLSAEKAEIAPEHPTGI
jgi:hypothetical protein